MQLDLATSSDEDFARGLVLIVRYPDFDPSRYYNVNDRATFSGKVWSRTIAGTGVDPGSDATVWSQLTVQPTRDLTGWSFIFQARAPAKSGFASISVSTDTGDITITNAPGGAVTVSIPRAQLLVLAAGGYDYSLVGIRPDGIRERILHGVLTHEIGASR